MPNFTELLKLRYEQHPEQVAVTLLQSGAPDLPVTYRALLEGAAGYGRTYAQNGIQPGEVVILILQHGIDLLHAYFGAVLSGIIPSIMPFLTEKLLPERYRTDLASLISVTQPSAVITYPDFESEARSALRRGDSVRSVMVTGQVEGPRQMDFSACPGLYRRGEDIALLQHSSGTTGLQKGVALSHQAVCNQLEHYRQAIHLNASDVFVSWLPLYHDMGLIACYLMPILLGSPLVLLSPFDWVRAPYRLMRAVSQYKGTLSWLPNFAYNFCAQKVRDRDLEGVDLSTWRAVSNCSEPMHLESHQAFFFFQAEDGIRDESLTTCYAMAENVFAVTQGGIDAPVAMDEVDRDRLQIEGVACPAIAGKASLKMLGAGKPIQNTSVQILDNRGHPRKVRTIGEIALKSDCMLTGYYHRPDETERVFREGWYLTGDLGYMTEDGEVYVTGRKKDLIIVGGKNIYPQDLELLAYQVRGVHAGRASAFGIFDENSGTEDVVLVAEVETDDPAELQRISNEVRQTVTLGSAVTLRYVHLVRHPWMVKTSSGKTARSANREKFLKEIEKSGKTF